MDTYEMMFRRPLPVKAATTSNDFDFDESLIDRVLGTPQKIDIPERYIPEKKEQLPPEEEQKRSQKAEAICRLLSKSNGPIPLVLPLPPKPNNQADHRPQHYVGQTLCSQQPRNVRHGQLRDTTIQQSRYQLQPAHSTQCTPEYVPHPSHRNFRNSLNNRGYDRLPTEPEQLYYNDSLGHRHSSGSANNLEEDVRRGMRGLSLVAGVGVQSVPCSPVRRSVPVKKSLSTVRKGGRSSSSYCDWSLAGVNAPSSPFEHTVTETSKGLNESLHESQYQYYEPSVVHKKNIEKKSIRRVDSTHNKRGVPSHSHHSSYSSTSSGRSSSDREELLHLQHNLAREVTEKSRIVAVRALASSPGPYRGTNSSRYRVPSPPSPVELPTVQQREGFFT